MKKYITLIMLMGALIPAGAQCLEAQEGRGV